MEDELSKSGHDSWYSYLFRSHDYATMVAVSVAASGGIYMLGFVISALGGLEYYFIDPWALFCLFGGIWGFIVLGWIDGTYVGVWREVRPAFAVDDETYKEIVHTRLERIFDVRRSLVYGSVLWVPYFVIVPVFFLRDFPFHRTVYTTILRAGRVPFPGGIPRIAYYYLFGVVGLLITGSIIALFVNHLGLIREVSDFPFRDIQSSASEMEPIAWFSMALATAWFVGASVIAIILPISVDPDVIVLFLAPLVLTGTLLFLAPQVILHSALVDAKRDEIVALQDEQREIHRLTQRGSEPAEDLSLRLEASTQRLENAKSVRTWVYDISSVSKLVAASLIPWLNLFIQILAYLPD